MIKDNAFINFEHALANFQAIAHDVIKVVGETKKTEVNDFRLSMDWEEATDLILSVLFYAEEDGVDLAEMLVNRLEEVAKSGDDDQEG